MEFIVTYDDENGIQHVAHVTNAADRRMASKMAETCAGGTISVVSVEVATITIPQVR